MSHGLRKETDTWQNRFDPEVNTLMKARPSAAGMTATEAKAIEELALRQRVTLTVTIVCLVAGLAFVTAAGFEHSMERTITIPLRISAMGALLLVGIASWVTPSSFSHLKFQMPNVNLSAYASEAAFPPMLYASDADTKLRRMMFMDLPVGELLSNHMHLSRAILEDYVLGLLDERTERAVKKHLRGCERCRNEIDAAEATMRRASAGKPAHLVSAPEIDTSTVCAETEPEFSWEGGATLWLNDASYTIVPVEGNPLLARVRLLTLWQLLDRVNEDEKSPGTYLASIELKDNMMTFPLSRFREVQMAVAASSGASGGYLASPRQTGCVNRRVLQCATGDFTVDVFADEGDNVYLSARSNE